VLDGSSSPLPKTGGQRSQVLAHVYCAQTAGWIKMPLGMEVGLGPGHTVLPIPKTGHSRQFLAHVCCGQTPGWIKMPLGTKVGLGPGRIVLHGDPAPTSKRGTAPNFRPMSIVAKWSPILATAAHLFYRPDAVPDANQQCQSTEGQNTTNDKKCCMLSETILIKIHQKLIQQSC